MAQVTLKIKIDLPGLRNEIRDVINEIETKLAGVGEVVIDADTQAAEAGVENVTESIDQTKEAAEETRKSFSEWGNVLTGLKSAIDIIQQGVQKVRALVEASETQELSVKRLTLSFQQQGNISARAAQENTEAFTQWASSMQQVTNFGDEVINKSASLTNQMLKLDQEGLRRATLAGMDLAEALDTNLFTSMQRISTAVESGLAPFRGASREFVELLRQTDSAEKRLELTLKFIEDKFGGTAVSMKSDLKSFDNTVGDLYEVLGKILTQGFAPLLRIVQEVLTGFNNLDPAIQATIIGLGGLTAVVVALNTSLGGLPLIIGGIVTALMGATSLLETMSKKIELVGNEADETSVKVNKLTKELEKFTNAEIQKEYDETTKKLYENLLSGINKIGEAARKQGLSVSEYAKNIGMIEYDFQGQKYWIDLSDEETQSYRAKYEALLQIIDLRNSQTADKDFELAKLRVEAMNEGYAKELAALELWLQEESEKYKGKEEYLTELRRIYNNKRRELDKKYLEASSSELEEIEVEDGLFRIAKAEEIEQKRIEVSTTGKEKELKLLDFWLKQEFDKYKDDQEMKDLLLKEHEQKRNNIIKKYNEEERREAKKTIEEQMSNYIVLTDFLISFVQQEIARSAYYSDAQVQLTKLQHEKELDSLKRQFAEGQITEEEYNLRKRVEAENLNDYLIRVEEARADWTTRFASQALNFLIDAGKKFLQKYIIDKATEAAITSATETEKTAVAVAGSQTRTASTVAEITAQTTAANVSLAELTAATVAAMAVILEVATTTAFMVSTATFGGAAISGQVAMIQGLSVIRSLAQFYTGGYTGDGDPEDVAGFVHKKEHVFESNLVSKEPQNFELLHDALRKGWTLGAIFSYLAKAAAPIQAPQALSGIDLSFSNSQPQPQQNIQQSVVSAFRDGTLSVEFEPFEIEHKIQGSDIYKLWRIEAKIQAKKEAKN